MNGYLTPDWTAPSNIRAYTVLRTSQHTLQLPSEPVWLNQIHGNNIIDASISKNAQADASYATQNNIVCVIRTADCLPVLITDKQGRVVVAIHAGWKSIANNILELSIEKLEKLGKLEKLNISPKDLLVWLGPAISAKYYEVGEDMKDFFKNYPEGFSPVSNKPNKYLADLYKLARLRLANLNIENNNIFGGNFCTYSRPELFHSARRDKEKSGRVVTMIWKE